MDCNAGARINTIKQPHQTDYQTDCGEAKRAQSAVVSRRTSLGIASRWQSSDLEAELRRELDCALLIAGRPGDSGDCAYARRVADRRVRSGEVRVVEDVERVRPKLHVVPLLEQDVLLQVHVPVLEAGPAQHVIAGVSISGVGGCAGGVDVDGGAGAGETGCGVARRRDERCRVEPLRLGLVTGIERHAGDPVCPSAYLSSRRTRCGVGHREGLPGLDVCDAGDLPSADDLADKVAGAGEKRLSTTERQQVGVVEGQHLRSDAGYRPVAVVRICTGRILDVLRAEHACPLVFRSEGDAVAVLLMQAKLQ